MVTISGADAKIAVEIDTIADATKLLAYTKQLNQLKSVGINVDLGMQQLNKSAKEYGTSVKKMSMAVKRFRMELLSIMFFSMGVQRVLQSIGTSAIAEFKRATEKTTFWSSAIGRLSIAFSLMKIAIGEAINQALRPFSDWLTDNLDMILELVSQDQIIKFGFSLFTTAVLGAAIASTILGVDGINRAAGTTGLAGLGLVLGLAFAIQGVTELITGNVLKGLSKIFSGIGLTLVSKGVGGALGPVLLASGLVLGLSDLVKDGTWTLMDKLNALVQAGFLGFVIGGWWGVGLGLVAVLALEVIIKNPDFFDDFMPDTGKPYFGKVPGQPIGTHQFGGVIPADGLYSMHAGERITNQSFSPNISVTTGPISSQVDATSLARTVSSIVMRDIKRHTQPVGRYG